MIRCDQKKKSYFLTNYNDEMEARKNEKESKNKSPSESNQAIEKSRVNDKDFDKYLFPLLQVMFPANELMEWKEPNSTDPTTPKCCHHELWDCVIKHLNTY